MTQTGRATLVNLYGNRSLVEKELDRFYKRDFLRRLLDLIGKKMAKW